MTVDSTKPLRQLDRLARAAPAADVQRLIGHTPVAIRYVSEVCRHLSDPERAAKLLAHVTPWAGQILVGLGSRSKERPTAPSGTFGHARPVRRRRHGLRGGRRARALGGISPLVARTQYWRATLLDRDAPDDRERSARCSTTSSM